MRGAVWLLFVYSHRLDYGMQLEALAEQLVLWTVQSQLTNAQVPLFQSRSRHVLPSRVDHSSAQGCGCAVIGTRRNSLQQEQYPQLDVAKGHASSGALRQQST